MAITKKLIDLVRTYPNFSSTPFKGHCQDQKNQQGKVWDILRHLVINFHTKLYFLPPMQSIHLNLNYLPITHGTRILNSM